MNRFARIFALATLTLAVLGCESRTDKSDGGGILLSLSIDGWPAIISVSSPEVPPVTIEQMIVKSVIKNPGQPTSELMKVEIDKYEVTFSATTPAAGCRPGSSREHHRQRSIRVAPSRSTTGHSCASTSSTTCRSAI
jgi:hypothetical protein